MDAQRQQVCLRATAEGGEGELRGMHRPTTEALYAGANRAAEISDMKETR